MFGRYAGWGGTQHIAHMAIFYMLTRIVTLQLKLYFQGDQGRFLESKEELEGCLSVGDLVSHASFSSDKGFISLGKDRMT